MRGDETLNISFGQAGQRGRYVQPSSVLAAYQCRTSDAATRLERYASSQGGPWNRVSKLDPLVKKCDGIADAYMKAQDAVAALNLLGRFDRVVAIDGLQVTVRGNVSNGNVSITTMFIP